MKFVTTRYGVKIVPALPTHDEVVQWIYPRQRANKRALAKRFGLKETQASALLRRLQQKRLLRVYRTKPMYSYGLTKPAKFEVEKPLWQKLLEGVLEGFN